MSQSATSTPVAEALSTDEAEALGSRDNWWGDSDTATTDTPDEIERVDPNNPAEIVAHKILRETGTMICAATLRDEPGIEGGETAALFAFLDGETWDKYAMHTENKAVELSAPAVRLGIHDPDSSLVGEWGTERHRKRINPETGYLSGGETTGVLIQDRPTDELVSVVEDWVRGVAARDGNGLTEDDVDEAVAYTERLKENTNHNGMRDVDIVEKVVAKVR